MLQSALIFWYEFDNVFILVAGILRSIDYNILHVNLFLLFSLVVFSERDCIPTNKCSLTRTGQETMYINVCRRNNSSRQTILEQEEAEREGERQKETRGRKKQTEEQNTS